MAFPSPSDIPERAPCHSRRATYNNYPSSLLLQYRLVPFRVPSHVVQSRGLPSFFLLFPRVSSSRSTSFKTDGPKSRFLKAPWMTSSRPPSAFGTRTTPLPSPGSGNPHSRLTFPFRDRDLPRVSVLELTARSLPDLALTDSRLLYFQSNCTASVKQ